MTCRKKAVRRKGRSKGQHIRPRDPLAHGWLEVDCSQQAQAPPSTCFPAQDGVGGLVVGEVRPSLPHDRRIASCHSVVLVGFTTPPDSSSVLTACTTASPFISLTSSILFILSKHTRIAEPCCSSAMVCPSSEVRPLMGMRAGVEDGRVSQVGREPGWGVCAYASWSPLEMSMETSAE